MVGIELCERGALSGLQQVFRFFTNRLALPLRAYQHLTERANELDMDAI